MGMNDDPIIGPRGGSMDDDPIIGSAPQPMGPPSSLAPPVSASRAAAMANQPLPAMDYSRIQTAGPYPQDLMTTGQYQAGQQAVADAQAMGMPQDFQTYAKQQAQQGADPTALLIPHPDTPQMDAIGQRQTRPVSGLSPKEDAERTEALSKPLGFFDRTALGVVHGVVGSGLLALKTLGSKDAGAALDHLNRDVKPNVDARGPQGYLAKHASNLISGAAQIAAGSPIFLGSIAADADTEADEHGLTGHEKLLHVAAQVGIAEMGGRIIGKALGGPIGKETFGSILSKDALISAAKEVGKSGLGMLEANALGRVERTWAGIDKAMTAGDALQMVQDSFVQGAMLTGTGAVRSMAVNKWAEAHPQEAAKLAESPAPSRKVLQDAGVAVADFKPTAEQRRAFIESLKLEPAVSRRLQNIEAVDANGIPLRENSRRNVGEGEPVAPDVRQAELDQIEAQARPIQAREDPKLQAAMPYGGEPGRLEPGAPVSEEPQSLKDKLKEKFGFKPKTEAVPSRSSISNRMKYELMDGKPMEIGKTHIDTAAGFFDVAREYTRKNGEHAGDLYVDGHEAAHYIDKKEKITESLPKVIRDELAKLDYDPKAARPEEGFSEYMAESLTRDNFEAKAPKFAQWMRENKPAVLKKFASIRKDVDRYRAADVEEQVKADTRQPGQKEFRPWKQRLEHIDAAVADIAFDPYAKAERAELKLGRESGKPIADKDSPHEYQTHLASGGNNVYDQARYGPQKFDSGRRYSKGLEYVKEAFSQPSPERWQQFKNMRLAEGTLMREAQGKQGFMTTEQARQIHARYKNDPEMREALKRQQQMEDGWLQSMVESGAMTKKDVERIRASRDTFSVQEAANQMLVDMGLISDADVHDIYTGVKRVFGEQEKAAGGSGGKPINPYSGSGREVYDLDASDIARYKMYHLANERAHVANLVVEAANSREGSGWFAHPVEGWKEGDKLAGNEKVIIRNGEREAWHFAPSVYEDFFETQKVPTPKMAWKVVKWILSAPARAVRFGATGPLSAGFQLSNAFMRDPQTFLRHTKLGITEGLGKLAAQHFYNQKAVLQHAITGSMDENMAAMFRLLKMTKTDMSTYMGSGIEGDYAKARSLLEDIGIGEKKGMLSRLWSTAKTGGTIGEMGHAMEMAPRIVEASIVLRKHGIDPADLAKHIDNIPGHILLEVAKAAQNVTQNFGRASKGVRALNSYSPYLNAHVQGWSQELRYAGMKTADPRNWDRWKMIHFAARAAAVSTTTSMALWFLNRDDDQYKELPGWRRRFFMNVKVGGQYIPIPRASFVDVFFGGFAEETANALYQKENLPAPPGLLSEGLGGTIAKLMPTAFKVPLELKYNYDSFRGRPIVDENTVGKLKPEDQAYQYTSGIAKWLGEWKKWSPIKIDYAANNLTGGIAGRAMQALDKPGILPKIEHFAGMKRFDVKELAGTIEEFYKSAGEAEQAAGSAKLHGNDDDDIHARTKLYSHAKSIMSAMRASVRGSDDEEARGQVDRYIGGLARQVQGKEELKRYPNPFTDDDAPQGVKDAIGKYLDSAARTLSAKDPDDPVKLRKHLADVREKLDELGKLGCPASAVRKAYLSSEWKVKNYGRRDDKFNQLSKALAKLD